MPQKIAFATKSISKLDFSVDDTHSTTTGTSRLLDERNTTYYIRVHLFLHRFVALFFEDCIIQGCLSYVMHVE